MWETYKIRQLYEKTNPYLNINIKLKVNIVCLKEKL